MFREIAEPALDPRFLAGLRRLTDRLAPHFSWSAAAKIPRKHVEAAMPKQLRDLAVTELLGSYGYLATASNHRLGRALGAARGGVDAARCYELLCLNLAVDERDLAFALSPAELDDLAADGVLIRQGSAVMLPVSLIPYGDRYYIADAWHLKDNHELYGTKGAPIGFDTWLQIEHLKHRLEGRKIGRLLEIGPGTGIVLAELRGLAETREGAEYDARTLRFAQANLELWGDHDARVYQSDLLSGATGHYDLIMFNPWQPSEDYVDLILRFLVQAAERITPDGAISLLLSTREEGGRDVVMEAVSQALAAAGLVAERTVVQAFTAHGKHGRPTLVAQHFSWIQRGESRAGANITDRRSLPWLAYQGRQLAQRLRRA